VSRRPASLLVVMLALLAAAAGSSLNARAAIVGLVDVGRARALAAGAELSALAAQAELAVLLADLGQTRLRTAKRRAELRLIDFVELMWPVVEREQPFVRSWVQEAICLHLEAVHDGRITNLLMNVPPGSTKSFLTCVFFPAWEWGPKKRPDLRFMAWSYSPKLTEAANENCRKIIESPLYQQFWGAHVVIDRDSDAKNYFRNSAGGWCRSSSVGGASTGFRADRLIWDDPHNVKDVRGAGDSAKLKEATHWFSKSLPTRVRNASGNISKVKVPYWVRAAHGQGLENDPLDGARKATVSATIGIMQRVHLHDLSGIVLRNPALGYEVLLIEMRFKGDRHPARMLPTWRGSTIGYQDPRTRYGDLCDPIRFPEDAVAKLEAQLMLEGGSDAVAAQLDQWPMEAGGKRFRAEWLPIVEPHQVPADVSIGKRGWDWASGEAADADRTADARVGRSASSRKFYLWDTHAMRGGPGAVDAFIRQRHADDPPAVDWSIPRDPGATGKLFAAYVVRELAAGRHIHSSPETGNKDDRLKPVSAQAEHGNFFVVRHPGCEVAIAELIDHPYGDFDDINDAISRAFAAVVMQPEEVPTVLGGYIVGERR
jgi:predicted phage terminase large subunit-like protein